MADESQGKVTPIWAYAMGISVVALIFSVLFFLADSDKGKPLQTAAEKEALAMPAPSNLPEKPAEYGCREAGAETCCRPRPGTVQGVKFDFNGWEMPAEYSMRTVIQGGITEYCYTRPLRKRTGRR